MAAVTSCPPMEFEKLLYNLDLDESLVEKINVLLEKKRAGVEMGLEPKIHEINRFIEKKIVYFEKTPGSLIPIRNPTAGYLMSILSGYCGRGMFPVKIREM